MFKLGVLLVISYAHVAHSTLRGRSRASSVSDVNTVSGECTVANFASSVGGKRKLASLLGSAKDDASMQSVLDARCGSALEPKIDLSNTLGKEPQFLKDFLDGGTTWNDNYEESDYYKLAEEAVVIGNVDASSAVFAPPHDGTSAYYPRFFSNFFYEGNEECPFGVIECCYTSSREVSKPFVANAEVCDLYNDGESSDQAYCTGFAYENGAFGDAVKYNTLFHLAMETNLKEKSLVKNVPGAPLCGCVEQMPIVDNADCVEPVEGYTIDSNGEVKVNITWKSCGTDLVTYYDSLNRPDVEKYFVSNVIVGTGQCPDGSGGFMNNQGLLKSS